ncbi:uncharacterized protein LOC125654832 [Ostrea edulis]|uniref:uncharacterized protein LOC125654832 n=1 Tax=Ostrea edulis TaxID=37623 RepID=UPI0024AEC1A7|nr:uncharacterized protein LOC125654832 [Ostrea edulis]
MASSCTEIDVLENVNSKLLNFAFLRLGKKCNASESLSFARAVCNISSIKENEVLTVMNFDTLFNRGVNVLKDMKRGITVNMQQHDKTAVAILTKFLKEIEFHERSLMKVLGREQIEKESKSNSRRENEITVTLAEHLLGRLSPGQSYVINSRAKSRETCSCGEDHENNPTYRNTGIGHEDVWHGFVDVVLENAIASAEKPRVIDEDNKEGMDEFDGRTQTGDQSIAETISFSFIQKACHPSFENHLVPNIMIDSERFRILMYDADKDILLCGMDFPIFYENHLNITSVVILWLVLHYRIFCSGINDTPEELEKVKCNFTEVAGEKLEIYRKSLKAGVANFPTVKKETSVFPSYESILFGKRKW